MNKAILPVVGVLLFLFSVNQVSCQKYTVSGYLKDASSGEALIGANIFDSASYVGTTTNSYGFYSMKLEAGRHVVVFSYVGYNPQILNIDLQKDTTLTFELNPGKMLDEVVVKADAKDLVESTQTSSHKVEMIELKKMPAFLGEIDLMKGIQKLPGIQSGNEVFSGIYVRGGSPGQNLILLDGVPVYNVNHLFGFFSVFNTDAINNVEVMKGGFPARYGGRLSSVIDIRMKEGNMKNYEYEGSIGLLSAKLTISGPIIKDKTSFIISGRRSYFDVFTRLISASQDLGDAGFWFGDLNVKVNHKFSSRDRLYLSAYTGEDNFYFGDEWSDGDIKDIFDFELKWGNITSSARWNHVFSGNLFSNTTFTYSRFRFSENLMIAYEDKAYNDYYSMEQLYFSGIQDYSLKVDFDYYPDLAHQVKFGADYIYHIYSPGVSRFSAEASDMEAIHDEIGTHTYANELSAYIEDTWEINDAFKTNIGARYSAYFVDGETYQSLEPRFSIRSKLAQNFSLKGSVAYMKQYIHLLTNTSVTLPTDLWVPATKNVPPQKSWQYALGANWLIDNSWKLSLEAYYKDMLNVIAYREGAQFVPTDKNWENKVASGRGWSYGAEFMGEKSWKKTSVTLAYTLSWSNRQFEDINMGKAYPYKYDRRHDVNFSFTHAFGERVDLALNWIYTSGSAFTIPFEFFPDPGDPISSYSYADNVTYFESRNNYRAPSYHRLDIGINFHSNKKWGRGTWSLSLFNAYGRNNPVFMFVEEGNNGLTLKKYTFFKYVPSISYRFRIK